MTFPDMAHDEKGRLIPESEQTAVWLLGGLAQIRVPGSATRDSFTVVQHTGDRGYNTPLHVHHYEDEVFIVLDGTLRMVCDGEEQIAEAGSTMIVPRTLPHGFVTTSERARFLTIHSTPQPDRRPQFDRFLAAELPHAKALTLPTEDLPGPDLDHLVALGSSYAFRYAGPAPTP
ncbi:cupin domain-containing protein [Streptomyces cadmiisoli]|uniref:Cupin domain-containing protein n=1 Tax=Streptomyces cadmiisoli TaxID=2184053 RepID=A0A2Z4J7P6_9ACTN|nr:cupin domain-containing protein [Streptomyces cadmiisoli]AWW40947.1 cupin domain-containing protein [Streptomyces cadmiisoli]